MSLELSREAPQLYELRSLEGLRPPEPLRNGDLFEPHAVQVRDLHLPLLRYPPFANHSGSLVEGEGVGRHSPGDELLPLTQDRLDDDRVAVARGGMHRKADTRLLTRDLPLHDDGRREEIDAESLLQPVADSPRGIARGPASPDRRDDLVLLGDVEVCRLLTREARITGVLGRR